MDMSSRISAEPSRSFDERSIVVLVVGASSGIGLATAERLVAQGHRVFGTARDASRVRSNGVESVQLDVTQDQSVSKAVANVLDRVGRIDAVVYSAGFYVAGAVEETTDEDARDQFDVYFFGAHRVTRAILPSMRAQRRGRLIYMSSSAGVAAIPFHVLYSASKAAIEHYADGLRYEIERFGVQVCCVQGTGVRTSAATNARFTEPIPSYEPARSRIIESFKRALLEGPPPDAFAEVIANAVTARRMRRLYRVGALAMSLPVLKALLPAFVFRGMFVRHFSGSSTDRT
jgi:NAD(P)-dependent dehydrogenase (short-subunit alcohol dehydrogenase family)